MDLLNNPLLRRTLAPQPEPDPHAEPRKRLLDALLQMRERAKMLAGEIHRDLPDFTVHDITHLDALWEMADLIAGPDYPLNPLEAFALGAVFLLHDLGLGLAAYPGGLAELKKGPGWQDALSTYLRKHLERIPTAEELASPPPEVERMAVQERLRILHAEQAERLALASWRHGGGPEYHLIDDPDLRQAIGPLLGKVAHSHWWPVSRLGNEFGTVRGALTNCPRDWTLDPLKIAVLLRTADAAHLDERRAPGFLIALRRPEGLSKEHWRFQNHLLKPRVDDDRLVYTTNRPFPPEEVNDWWLCEETLRMVDRELHQVDSLLADRGHPSRLRVRGVAGADSPRRLQEYVGASGWTPVDARLHVSNVADLARRLGGEQLYGDDPTVPLRELIQNASDAVRARRLLEDRPGNWGRVIVRLGRDERGPWVEVEDNGIGMSEAVMRGPLLDFGTTYWGSALMREEHEGLWAKGFEPTGRFGIGFFSVFMWGRRVRVTTRRCEDAQRESRVLEFWTGLESRPLLRPARPDEQVRDGGTRVRIWLNREPDERGGLLNFANSQIIHGLKNPLRLGKLCSWLAPALDVDLYVEDENGMHCEVAASDWLTMAGAELLARTHLGRLDRDMERASSLLQIIKDAEGRVLGRAAIFDHSLSSIAGVIAVGGLRAAKLNGAVGILIGSVEKVDRKLATPLASTSCLASWASHQAKLIPQFIESPRTQLACAACVLHYGGDPNFLPIAVWEGGVVGRDSLVSLGGTLDEVAIVSLMLPLASDDDITLNPGVLVVYSLHLSTSVESGHKCQAIIWEAMAEAWGCLPDEIVVDIVNNYDVGVDRNGSPEIVHGVTIFQRPTRQE